jgi:hypothetical protein
VKWGNLETIRPTIILITQNPDGRLPKLFFTFWILREYFNDGQLFWLILDCYSVHRSEDIKKSVEKIGIKVLFIPAGMADAYQPLDLSVFGVMKASGRRMYRQFLSDDLSLHE